MQAPVQMPSAVDSMAISGGNPIDSVAVTITAQIAVTAINRCMENCNRLGDVIRQTKTRYSYNYNRPLGTDIVWCFVLGAVDVTDATSEEPVFAAVLSNGGHRCG